MSDRDSILDVFTGEIELTCPDCDCSFSGDSLGAAIDWAANHDCDTAFGDDES